MQRLSIEYVLLVAAMFLIGAATAKAFEHLVQ
jgi:hypothetical protein